MYGGSRSEAGRAGPWIAAAVVLLTALLGLRVPGPAMAVASAEPLPTSTPTDSTSTPTESASPSGAADPTPSPSGTPGSWRTPSGSASSDSTPSGDPNPPASPEPSTPPPSVTGAEPVVGGFILARIDQSCAEPSYLPANAAAAGVGLFDILRIRFRIDNTGDAAVVVAPQLEYRPAGTALFRPLETQPTPGEPFALESECRQHGSGRHVVTETLPTSRVIHVPGLLLQSPGSGRPVPGEHETGANPAPGLRLPAGAGTEQEFTIRAGIDLAPDVSYEFRLTDAGAPLPGDTATVVTAPKAGSQLSPRQRHGTDVTQRPRGSLRGRGPAYPLTARRSAARAFGAATDTIHGPYGLVTDQCSACHRAHTAPGQSLLAAAGPTSNLCLTCHNGTGAADLDVAAQYVSARANNPATASYYQHDALAPSAHTLASDDEFGGVSNRHSECVDCHNPHQAANASPTQGAAGWTTSGLLAGVSGVAVTNGAAGTAPTYAFLNGVGTPVTLEYQLCFKCHSGFTQLRASDPDHPSWDALDKAIELNPANASFHPIEAQGTNQTTAMAASLAGTSPYKIWDFDTTSTIRCENCHANGTISSTPPPNGTPPASGVLSNHASANRGILLRPYRDRVLLAASESYSAADYALCYVCHAEGPYVNSSSPATRFGYHAFHVSDPDFQEWGSGGTDIDTPGAGQSSSVCAECHFRLHSTTFKVGDQSIDGSRLVNFAPNVLPWIQYNPDGSVRSITQPTWNRRPDSLGGGGTCTLVCHGKVHNNLAY